MNKKILSMLAALSALSLSEPVLSQSLIESNHAEGMATKFKTPSGYGGFINVESQDFKTWTYGTIRVASPDFAILGNQFFIQSTICALDFLEKNSPEYYELAKKYLKSFVSGSLMERYKPSNFIQYNEDGSYYNMPFAFLETDEWKEQNTYFVSDEFNLKYFGRYHYAHPVDGGGQPNEFWSSIDQRAFVVDAEIYYGAPYRYASEIVRRAFLIELCHDYLKNNKMEIPTLYPSDKSKHVLIPEGVYMSEEAQKKLLEVQNNFLKAVGNPQLEYERNKEDILSDGWEIENVKKEIIKNGHKYLSDENGTYVEVNDNDIEATIDALSFMKKNAPEYYEMVKKYLSGISHEISYEQMNDYNSNIDLHNPNNAYPSGGVRIEKWMEGDRRPLAYFSPREIYSGKLEYASYFVREAYRVKLYHDYFVANNIQIHHDAPYDSHYWKEPYIVPEDIYKGPYADKKCFEEQNKFFKSIGAIDLFLDIEKMLETRYKYDPKYKYEPIKSQEFGK